MKKLAANMAGIIVKILVKPGDIVNEGTEVVLLESMKMQIPITANTTGKVSKIHIAIGDFVNEGDTLITCE